MQICSFSKLFQDTWSCSQKCTREPKLSLRLIHHLERFPGHEHDVTGVRKGKSCTLVKLEGFWGKLISRGKMTTKIKDYISQVSIKMNMLYPNLKLNIYQQTSHLLLILTLIYILFLKGSGNSCLRKVKKQCKPFSAVLGASISASPFSCGIISRESTYSESSVLEDFVDQTRVFFSHEILIWHQNPFLCSRQLSSFWIITFSCIPFSIHLISPCF